MDQQADIQTLTEPHFEVEGSQEGQQVIQENSEIPQNNIQQDIIEDTRHKLNYGEQEKQNDSQDQNQNEQASNQVEGEEQIQVENQGQLIDNLQHSQPPESIHSEQQHNQDQQQEQQQQQQQQQQSQQDQHILQEQEQQQEQQEQEQNIEQQDNIHSLDTPNLENLQQNIQEETILNKQPQTDVNQLVNTTLYGGEQQGQSLKDNNNEQQQAQQQSQQQQDQTYQQEEQQHQQQWQQQNQYIQQVQPQEQTEQNEQNTEQQDNVHSSNTAPVENQSQNEQIQDQIQIETIHNQQPLTEVNEFVTPTPYEDQSQLQTHKDNNNEQQQQQQLQQEAQQQQQQVEQQQLKKEVNRIQQEQNDQSKSQVFQNLQQNQSPKLESNNYSEYSQYTDNTLPKPREDGLIQDEQQSNKKPKSQKQVEPPIEIDQKAQIIKQYSQSYDEAAFLKNQGNQYFAQKDYQRAIQQYTAGLGLCEHYYLSQCPHELLQQFQKLRIILLSNLSACYLNIGLYNECITYANMVLNAEPQNMKALYRRALSYQGRNDFEEAFRDIDAAWNIVKNSTQDKEIFEKRQEIRQQLKEYNQQYKQQSQAMFQKMMSSETPKQEVSQIEKSQIVESIITNKAPNHYGEMIVKTAASAVLASSITKFILEDAIESRQGILETLLLSTTTASAFLVKKTWQRLSFGTVTAGIIAMILYKKQQK